ncbi:hypothetical protein dsx2_0723 [Desulfovibrio sp. X2]|uniref:hypothetical protein n=1 Tax=Desulfovibrio sp. X2 TaxID=941449 RepID=UPI000358789B|nr:hypothetical protein [Desulfovibrio sp. X2]EPR37377.1 hypothetical protein dsx2_0723 [Desulfovibrio sp. X2]
MARNKSSLAKGIFLLVTFVVLFAVILMPVFGQGRNGLEYSDELFNKLSKGSSYFIPEVREGVAPLADSQVSVTVSLKKPENAGKAVGLLQKAGLTASVQDGKVVYSGNLGTVLNRVIKDSDDLYHDDAQKLTDFYGMDGMAAAKLWFEVLSGSIKPLQKQKMNKEANAINLVLQKALEPGYNFYGIPAESVSSKAGALIGLLVFYVVYTLWYGFGIFELFEGIGLSMKKSKSKAEV